ncbi:MAG: hypothetical protein LBN74_00710 [Prevotella sp.]|jgi:hypothetical protein|nr:hypothetical protein [Prevotella sp.]
MATTENKYSYKRFLIIVSVLTILMLSAIGLMSYIVDPFFQFRVEKDSRYFLNPWLINGGLAKNYDYNTVILGSSMVQNYDLSILRKKDASVKPIKLSSGGMNNKEMEYLYSFIKKDSLKSIIINIDIPQLNLGFEEVRFPRFLYDNTFLNKMEYLYGYETCVRFMPIDIILPLYLKGKNPEDISPAYKMKTDIDNIGNNSYENEYNAEYVKELYLSGRTVSLQNLDGMRERMRAKLDTLLTCMEINKYKKTEYKFVLSPYSALYWYHTRKNGYYNQFIDFVYYLNKSVEKYDNAKLMFFSDFDEITDLNYYTDISHFNPELSNKVIDNVYNPEYELNSSNIEYKTQRLDSLVNVFTEKNKDWLPKN